MKFIAIRRLQIKMSKFEKVNKVNHVKFYTDIVVSCFREIFPFDDFRRNFKFMIAKINTTDNGFTDVMLKILIYRYEEDMTCQEICESLNIGEGYYRYWHEKAVKKLQKYINKNIVSNPLALEIMRQKNLKNKKALRRLYELAIQHRMTLSSFLYAYYTNNYDHLYITGLMENKNIYYSFVSMIETKLKKGNECYLLPLCHLYENTETVTNVMEIITKK